MPTMSNTELGDKGDIMNEKIFKGLSHIGASGIVIGIIMIVVGLTAGILSIVAGANALTLKKNILF